VDDYANAYVHYAREFSEPPILIGHSLGGLIAQLVAARMKTEALVLLAPSAPWGVPPTTINETSNAFGVAMLGDYWRRPIPPDFRIARQTTLDRLSRDAARRAFSRFLPESGRSIMEVVHWWLDRTMAAAAPAFKIDAPVLAMAGGQDHVNSSTTVRRIAARFKDGQAQFHEFPEMSHWLIGEPEWRDVANLSLDWLASKGLSPKKSKKKPLRLFGIGERPEA
jgi:alpha-beta hydrolase superfamily lysophospholipase